MTPPRAGRGRPAVALVALLVLIAIAIAGRPASASAAAQGGEPAPPALDATSAILFAPQTHQTLFGLAADREVAIASTTKLMTALVTLEHTRLDQVVTEPDFYFSAQDSQIGLVPGERMSVHDLMLAMLLPSADDAAEDLAYNVGHGSVARFVAMMNAQARRLGLRHTHYTTPVGLDTPGNYSTAGDLARLAAYDVAHEPFFARAVALKQAVLHTGAHVRVVVNRNDLVARFPWIHGVKTGHTLQAGYVLVTLARRNGMTLESVVLGTPSELARDNSTLALLDWGYAAFHPVTPVRRGQLFALPAVRDESGTRARVVASAGLTRILPRADPIRLRVRVPGQLSGPLARGVRVGTAEVLAGRRVVGTIPLVLARAVPAVSSLTVAARFITRTSTLGLLVAVLAVTLGIFLWWRSRAAPVGRREERRPA